MLAASFHRLNDLASADWAADRFHRFREIMFEFSYSQKNTLICEGSGLDRPQFFPIGNLDLGN